jgi:hypothetical protein
VLIDRNSGLWVSTELGYRYFEDVHYDGIHKVGTRGGMTPETPFSQVREKIRLESRIRQQELCPIEETTLNIAAMKLSSM